MIYDFATLALGAIGKRVRAAFNRDAMPRDDHMRADIGLPPLPPSPWSRPPGLR